MLGSPLQARFPLAAWFPVPARAATSSSLAVALSAAGWMQWHSHTDLLPQALGTVTLIDYSKHSARVAGAVGFVASCAWGPAWMCLF